MRLFVKKHNKTIVVGILLLLLLIQGLFLGYLCSQKSGYYWDELLTMRFSHEMGMGSCEDYYQVSQNEWMPMMRLQNYFTVEPEKSLLKSPIWFVKGRIISWNSYYLLSNVVRAIFSPNEISMWPFMVINLICFVFAQFLIFSITRQITRSNLASLLAVLANGFSGMTMAMTPFMRHYNLVIVLFLLFLYLHMKMLESDIWWKNLVFELLSFGALFFTFNCAPTTLVAASGIVFTFCIMLIVRKKRLQLSMYLLPIIPAGIYVLFKRGYIEVLLHPEAANSKGTAWQNLTQSAVELSAVDFLRRCKNLAEEIYCKHLTGNLFLFLVFGILLTIGIIRWQRSQQKSDSLWMIFVAAICHIGGSVVLNLDIERYSAHCIPLLILLLVGTVFGGEKKKTFSFLQTACAVLICLMTLINIVNPVDTYLYSCDREAVQTIRSYNHLRNVMIQTGWGTDEVTQEESIVFAGEQSELWYTIKNSDVYSFDGVTDEQVLVWIPGHMMSEDIQKDLQDVGYQMITPIATTHMSWVYLCER